MTISDIKELFEQKFSNHFDKLSVISKDNQFSLCNFKNQFLNFDSIAKEYYSSWATTDMIFFDLEREYIIFVEYKNSKMKSKAELSLDFTFNHFITKWYFYDIQLNDMQVCHLKIYRNYRATSYTPNFVCLDRVTKYRLY
jgi:hypothetical protein